MSEAEYLGTVELFKEALGKCRTCGHVKMAHLEKSKKIMCLESQLLANDRYVKCVCVLFIPHDNLEYLEWAAKRKEVK